jgi:hypothetical protein
MHGCTITSSHYLAHTRVLAESFRRRHPGAGFSVLLVDGPAALSGDVPFEALTPADIGIDREEFERRATMYIAQGLATSMKPDLLRTLLDRGDDPLLFIDADGYVYDDLSHLADLAREHSLVLSPHSNDPYPLWRLDSPEQIFIRAGAINAGLIAMSAQAQPFLSWWAQRTARRCVFDPARGLFLEQTWLMLAPALFEHHILRDRGCNVAGWNLHTRDVKWQGDTPTIDGGPLRHFHFAMSYDPEHPERLTASEHARWWPSLQERPGAARLSREYAERLIARGYRESRESPPSFDAMPEGAPIEPWMRAAYREALIGAEEVGEPEPPNPFAHGQRQFVDWVQAHAAGLITARSASSEARPREGAEIDQPDTATLAEDPFNAQEMAKAMMDTSKLLGRIRELEAVRDESVAWAERASEELEQAKAAIAQRDTLIAELKSALQERLDQLDEIWRSPSWRLTQPLRTAKGLITRGR